MASVLLTSLAAVARLVEVSVRLWITERAHMHIADANVGHRLAERRLGIAPAARDRQLAHVDHLLDTGPLQKPCELATVLELLVADRAHPESPLAHLHPRRHEIFGAEQFGHLHQRHRCAQHDPREIAQADAVESRFRLVTGSERGRNGHRQTW